MHPSYLRIKNWARHQHYDPLKRRPPWIKFYNDVLGDDDAFMRLSETEQWQLVRIWLVASRSSSLTLDETGKAVPVVANDAVTLQRSIMSVRRVPLAKFIRDGWLIPIEEEELLRPGASSGASAVASTRIAPLLGLEGLEGLEVKTNRPVGDISEEERQERSDSAERLLASIGEDGQDEGTRTVVLAFVQELPARDFDSISRELERCRPEIRNAGKWVNGALQKRALKRAAA